MAPTHRYLTLSLLTSAFLVGCSSRAEREWRQEQARLDRERDVARQVLSDAAPTTQQIMPMPLTASMREAEADYRLTLTLEAQGYSDDGRRPVRKHGGPLEVLLYRWPTDYRVPLLNEDGRLAIGGGASYGGWSHGRLRSSGEDFARQFKVSVDGIYDSGAMFHVDYFYVDNAGVAACLEGVVPVLWDVPVQMFYWPEGHIRVEIEPVAEATTRPATRPSPATRQR